MSLADVDIAVGTEGDHHRLPQQPLTRGLVPIPPTATLPDRQEQLPLRTQLHHRGAMGGSDPDVVLGIDRHAMGLVLIADQFLADTQDEAVVWIELEELRLAGLRALKDPEVVARIKGHGRHPAQAGGQYFRIGERVPQRLFPLDPLKVLAPTPHSAAADWRVAATRGFAGGRPVSGGFAAGNDGDPALPIDPGASTGVWKGALEKPGGRPVDGRPLGGQRRLREGRRGGKHQAARCRGDASESLSRHLSRQALTDGVVS